MKKPPEYSGGVFIFANNISDGSAACALTCPHTGVYIAALPGKKGGGCLSDQAGE